MSDLDLAKEIEILGYLLEQVAAIEIFNSQLDEDEFLRNELVKNASLMKLIVIGEHTTHLDERLKSRFSEVQWQLIKSARNYHAHVYRGVDWVHVWETIHTDIPALKTKIEYIIATLEKENNAKIN